ncbi:single-stranded DNA-binding protein [Nitrospira sp. BLG_2]|uniref:single-stranded DNA-binding protein n=1 Tax=Nitrospira sp. BLG_2 TaxID=3397507 RepID=UPI003B9C0AD5
MKGVNKAIIVGVVGQDPEINQTEQSMVVRISIATNEKWKDPKTGEDREETEWHRVIFFGKLAEIASNYVKKGEKLFIEGRLKTSKYTGKDGIERASTQIVANNMQLLGGSPQKAQATQKQQSSTDSQGYGDYKRKRPPMSQAPSPAQTTATNDFYNDEVPF